ncbi:MAG: translation initiation factor IF-2 N-terminal domain-containing protein, partial [Dethiobacter sp.]|nr:translation initiation factor IF-2 N-terminal domain-containing protein [Dethiobacter sp.]
MTKTRVYELAKELDVPSKRIIDILADIGFEVKNHMSVVEDEAVRRITYQITGKGEAPPITMSVKQEIKQDLPQTVQGISDKGMQSKGADVSPVSPMQQSGSPQHAQTRPQGAPGQSPRPPQSSQHGARPQGARPQGAPGQSPRPPLSGQQGARPQG